MGKNVDTLKAAIGGFTMEHSFKPDFILMSSDVFRAISIEVGANPGKYGGVVKIDGERISVDGIEVGQLTGHNRVELTVDPSRFLGASMLRRIGV